MAQPVERVLLEGVLGSVRRGPTDELAAAWGEALASPGCAVESLSLESNPFASAGVEAIAAALPSNSSLKELKMLNLHGRISQKADEALADALEFHTGLVKLSYPQASIANPNPKS